MASNPPRPQGSNKNPNNKRKDVPGGGSQTFRNKKQKIQRDARTLAVQTTSKAFRNGELDVDKFVKAREYEIRALEDGLARAKKGLTQRAFQQVPKELRRRTASHNAKKVPKRMRKRAEREMAEDNTPTVTSRRRKPTRHMRLRLETVKRLRAQGAKRRAQQDKVAEVKALMEVTHKLDDPRTPLDKAEDTIKTRQPRVKKDMLKSPPTPTAKFKKRQINKTWLPTHLFHTKRAHLTPPLEPLWRFAMPLTPSVKSYRPTHRASRHRGAMAWDTSYMSTIGLEGVEKSIEGLLRGLCVGSGSTHDSTWGARGQKWRNGTRVWQGWLYERDGYPAKRIAPATVIWRAQEKSENETMPDAGKRKTQKREAFIRVHPSAFLQLWDEIMRLSKIQKPQVVVEDLRFELGSIEITGPASTEALLGCLWPENTAEGAEHAAGSVETTWSSLAGLGDPSTLPPNVLLGFSISDPRLHHPPRTIKLPEDPQQTKLLHLLGDWPCDKSQQPPAIFDRKIRLASARSLPSQKAINRRKALATPGAYPAPVPTDPRIPVLLYASPTSAACPGKQAKWTVLLPWKAVVPLWYSIMYYPLSSGGQVRLGGLNEQRQIAFESGLPWFPGDFPGTEAGKAWEQRENDRRKREWERRPKGKRTAWESVDLGLGRKGEVGEGWACDWGRLLNGPPKKEDGDGDRNAADQLSRSPYHLPSAIARSLLTTGGIIPTGTDSPDLDTALVTVRLTLLSRGVAAPCARIYRLPTDPPTNQTTNPPTDKASPSPSTSLRTRWLALDSSTLPRRTTKSARNGRLPNLPLPLPPDAPPHLVQRRIAASLLSPVPPAGDVRTGEVRAGEVRAGEDAYPPVPDERDLVGFVTSGEFCLAEGRGAAVGSVVLGRVMCANGREERGEGRYCVVRNAGEGVGRLARWEIV
ncbi:Ribonucleases P/MRP protein subunit pop1 [Zalaria obscura]|uniref:Ribonucleases P/MRP protein subunit pop1 n=1 Tax=Zalaria obscura TaxID=2024903 RepID=A0ACC3SGH3_9PEZI